MKIKQTLEKLVKGVLKRPIRILAVAGLVGLSGLTIAKDNLHFGSMTLNNPQENHYVWGIAPKISVNGKAEGDMRAYGLGGGGNFVGDNSTLIGDMRAYGLIGGNNSVGDNSTLTGDIRAYSLIF